MARCHIAAGHLGGQGLITSHAPHVALPDDVKATHSSSADTDRGAVEQRRLDCEPCDTSLCRCESRAPEENDYAERNEISAAEVVSRSQKSLPRKRQGRLSQVESHNKNLVPLQQSERQTCSTSQRQQKHMTSPGAPLRLRGQSGDRNHRDAGVDVRILDRRLNSALSYECSQRHTAGSSKLPSFTMQVDDETNPLTGTTSGIIWESTPHGSSPNGKEQSPVASVSSAAGYFRCSVSSSASTTAFVSESLCRFSKQMTPSNSCSFDAYGSTRAPCYTTSSENGESLAATSRFSQLVKPPSSPPVHRMTVAEKQFRSPRSFPAASAAESEATERRVQAAGKPDPPDAAVSGNKISGSNVEFGGDAGEERGRVLGVFVSSTELANRSAPVAVVKESNASNIVVSSGLPSPESSAPVSLACRVIMRGFAAAAATATESRPCQVPSTVGGRRGGEGDERMCSETEGEQRCRSTLRLEQVQDCGWAWQEEGGGFLLLRLQRKQLDKGKVKSSGYKAFGREYGLPGERRMNCSAPWLRHSSHLSTQTETDDYGYLVKNMRHQSPGVPWPNCNSCDVVQTESSSLQKDSRFDPFHHCNALPSAKSSVACSASMVTGKTDREKMDVAAAAAPRSYLWEYSRAAEGSVDDPLHGVCWKRVATTNITRAGETRECTTQRWISSTSRSRDMHESLCQCCGDRRDELITCTRSANLLKTTAGSVCDGVAAAVHVTVPQHSWQGVRANFFSSSEKKARLQKMKTGEGDKQIHRMTSKARKRQSSCEGRLEGWRTQQLSVRAVVRTNNTQAAALWNRQNLIMAGRERLRKRVTFSMDCFSSDGETTSGVLCHISTPPRQSRPLRQPLISRVRTTSTCRLPGDMLSRSRPPCRLSDAAPTIQPGGRELTASPPARKGSATAALAGRDRGCSVQDFHGQGQSAERGASIADGLPHSCRGEGRCICSNMSVRGTESGTGCTLAAASVYSDDNSSPQREESFYILVDCKKPARPSRWSRRGRTVVSRSYTRYVGPLLPLVVDLLEKERAAARGTGCMDDSAQTQGKHGRTHPLWRRGKPSRNPEYAAHSHPQQHPQKHPEQQQATQPQQQHVVHHQTPRQQREQQQRQPLNPYEQRPQHEQFQRGAAQERQVEVQQPDWLRRGKDEQRQQEKVKKTAPCDITQMPPVRRQSSTQMQSKEKYRNAVSRHSSMLRAYQTGRTAPPSPPVYPRYHRPLDTPETLFPQACARQLRRLLMQQSTSTDDALVLPLMSGIDCGGASSSIEGKLAACHLLARRNVAARALVTAARHPAMLSQGSTLLQRQLSQCDTHFPSVHTVSEASRSAAAVHDQLRYATREAGCSPGFWRQPSPAEVSLRQAKRCSIAFEDSVREDGGRNCGSLRSVGTRQDQYLTEETDVELETEDDEDDEESEDSEDEEEEEARFRRHPRFFRMRRSSGAIVTQHVAEEERRLSPFASLTSILQRHGSNRLTTGEKLKRLLLPLFFRSSSSPAASTGPTEEEQEEKVCKRREVPAIQTQLKQQLEGLEESADDEDLWVTESDASTPPSSCIVVKDGTAKKLYSFSKFSASLVKKKNVLQSTRKRGTRPNPRNKEKEESLFFFPADSATLLQSRRDASLECPEPAEPENEHNHHTQRLLERDPQAFELPTVMEEPVEEAQTQGNLSERVVRTLTQKLQEEEKDYIQITTSRKADEESTCECKSVQEQQLEGRSSQVRREQERRSSQVSPRHLEDEEKQVEERAKETHQQKKQGQQAKVHQKHDRGNPGAQAALQQQLSAGDEGREGWPGDQSCMRHKETQVPHQNLDHMEQQQQQEPEEELQHKSQQEQQQRTQIQRSGGETLGNANHKPMEQERQLRSPLQREGQTTQRNEIDHVGTDVQGMKQQAIKHDTGVRDDIGDMQKQHKCRERRKESIDSCGNRAESEEAGKYAIQQTLKPPKHTQRLTETGPHEEQGQCAARQNFCKGQRPERLLSKPPNAERSKLEGDPGECEISASRDKDIQQICTQQSPVEHMMFSDVVRSLLPCSEQHDGSEHLSSKNTKAASCITSHEALHRRNEVDDCVVCNTIASQRTSHGVDTSIAAKEQTESYKPGDALSGKGCTRTRGSPRETPFTALSVAADEDISSEKKDANNGDLSSRLFVPRQPLLLKPLGSAEVGSSTDKNNKRGMVWRLRWRWRNSFEWGTDDRFPGGLDYLPSPGAAELCTEPTTDATEQAEASPVTVLASTMSRARANASPVSPLCSDEQVASSTTAGSQQTMNSSIHSWCKALKKRPLATVFVQMRTPWSTRTAQSRKDETHKVSSLLQRLPGRLGRRRACGTHGCSNDGGV